MAPKGTVKSRLIKHSIWNVIGQCIPLMVGFFAIPHLIENIGKETFGFLTIAWAIVGYFSIFDFGLGRVITSRFPVHLATNSSLELCGEFWSLLGFLFFSSLLVLILVSFFHQEFFHLLLSAYKGKNYETAFSYLILSLPFIVLSTCFRGGLEGALLFKEINLIQIVNGVCNFLVPAVLSYFTTNIAVIVLSLLIVRMVFCAWYGFDLFRHVPSLKNVIFFKFSRTWELIRMGGWLSVSNIIAPLFVYGDRFFVAHFLGADIVPLYTTPLDMITRLFFLPTSMNRAIFPEVSNSFMDPVAFRRLFYKSTAVHFLLGLVVLLGTLVLAHPFLAWWINPSFAKESAPVLKILSFGFLASCLCSVPYTYLQARTLVHITGIVHLFEVPLYVGLIMYLIPHYGITGAAAAWSLRCAVDALIFLGFGIRLIQKPNLMQLDPEPVL